MKGRTSLIIAHRLASVRGADRIVVLRQGLIVEEGSRDQLLRQGGLYAGLYWKNQFSFDDIKQADRA